MKRWGSILTAVGWLLVLGQLAFLAAALMSPTASLTGPVGAVYDWLVALFGGYRNEGALKLWGTLFFSGVTMVIAGAVLRRK